MEQNNTNYYGSNRSEMLEFIPKSALKILEIGCGEGSFSAQLKSENNETWGIEPNKKSWEIASQKLYKVINKTLENATEEIPDNYFDIIIMNDVLEHMFYPKDNLKLLHAKLNSKGKIVASIPNFRYIKNLFQIVVKGKWNYTDSGILDYTHFRFFTHKSTLSLFQDSGYEVAMIKGINKTKSVKYFIICCLFSLITLRNQFDTLYLQIAVMAELKNK